jgi:hypothetical protein
MGTHGKGQAGKAEYNQGGVKEKQSCEERRIKARY